MPSRPPDWRSYDEVAGAYAAVQAPIHALPAADLVALLAIESGGRVLDLGTGTGIAARAASEAAPSSLVVGVDPSVPMLREAERLGGGPHYLAATSIDLPFRDGSFRYVVANFVIAHFQRYDTSLYDIMRVLAPSGRMAVSCWGAGDERDEFRKAWRAIAEQFAERRILNDAQHRAIPWEERFSDPTRLKEVLREAGLRDIRVERRDYRSEVTAEEYLQGREVTAVGRFLRYTLGPELWEVFRARTRETFAQRFPPRFNDFREALLAVGHKPE